MKKHIFYLLMGCILLAGCATKTYTSGAKKFSAQSKIFTDSTSKNHSAIVDKSITITTRQIDTNIAMGRHSLSGHLMLKPNANDSTAYFENEYLGLSIRTDKKGNVTATATSKPQTVAAKMLETKTTFANVVKNTEMITGVKTQLQLRTDSSSRQSEKKIKGSPTFGFILPALLILAALSVFLIKKFNIAGKLLS